MVKYAEKTTVSSERSRAEIEKTLSRYGADGFMYGWNAGNAMVAFQMNGRRIQFTLAMPDKAERRFTHTKARGTRRTPEQIEKEYEQAVKQKWRALSLVIKAKLEAVESGISIFDEEFLANIVLPDGSTVGNFMLPQVKQAYLSGTMPPLLPYSAGKNNGK